MVNDNSMDTSKAPINPKLYGPLTSVIITIGIYFGAQLLGGVLLAYIPSLLHYTPQQADAWPSNDAWAQFLFIAVVETITLTLLYKFLKRRKANFTDIGFNKPKYRHVLYALAGFGLYFILYIAGIMIATKIWPGLNVDQKQELGFDMSAKGSALWLIFISLVILPPLVEEIVVRGFLFSGLRTRLPVASAAIIASVLFAAAHLGEGGKSGILWIAGLDTFILSMVLCYMKEKTGSLWPGIGVHMMKNGLAFVLLFNIVQYFR